MKGKKISFLLFVPLFAHASFVTIIGKENNYRMVNSIIKEYGSWNTISNVCSKDIMASDVYYDLTDTQTESCDKTEERNVDVYYIDNDGNKVYDNSYTESKIETTSSTKTITGTHLELSCNDIVSNGYSSIDGVYKLGSNNDIFDVYCDMRGLEGWTLIGKTNTASQSSINEPKDWFVSGLQSNKALSPLMEMDGGMASIGITNIEKIKRTNNVAEFKVIQQFEQHEVNFYKSIDSNNIRNWFNASESVSTTVCTDVNMSQNCNSSRFTHDPASSYVLVGMNLSDVGYTATGDIHYRFNENGSPHYSGLCSYTFSDPAWGDTLQDHWGNGLLIYIK